MRISGGGQEAYLYLNGLGVCRTIRLADSVELLPAQCTPMPEDIVAVAKSEVQIGIMTIFLRRVRSQFRVTAPDAKALAILAWNSNWDWVLLSALYDCEAVCNFECDKPAEEFNSQATLRITNYHLRGLTGAARILDETEASWTETHFEQARSLLHSPAFENAVHCLATYRWHRHPRARLALLWSGIEGLFRIDSELVFRLSLYIAEFLSPDSRDERKDIFKNVKELYKLRSAAVHGSELRGDVEKAVLGSVDLLQKLVRRCIVTKGVPIPDDLVP